MASSFGLSDRADRRLAFLIAIGWLALTLPFFWNSWPPDLSAMFIAGHFYATGIPEGVYAAPPGFFGTERPQLWIDFATSIGQEEATLYPYVYPPIWAAITAPLTQWLAPFAYFNLFLTVQLLMTAAAVFLVHRMVRPGLSQTIWAAICFALLWFSLISTSAFVHNQFQITVTFFIILAFERYAAGRSVAAGLALAVAATIKITPALLVLIFLLDRDWRAIAAFTVLGAIVTGASVMLAGVQLHLDFVDRLQQITQVVAVMKVNHNLEAYLFQLDALITGNRIDPRPMIRDQVAPEPLWITIVVRLTLLAGIVLVIWRTRALAPVQRIPARLIGLLLVSTLCAPLGWTHHYLPILLLLPMLFVFYPVHQAAAVIFAFGVVSNVQVFIILSRLSTVVHWHVIAGVTTMLAVFLLVVVAPRQHPARA